MTNRNYKPERLVAARVRVTNVKMVPGKYKNDEDGEVCGAVSTSAIYAAQSHTNSKIEINCPHTLKGRYVRITGPWILQLCEVEVMGSLSK